MQYPVVGHRFRGKSQADIAALSQDATVALEREPTNEYDPNAIKVLINGEHWGYIPKSMNEFMAQLMDLGQSFQATIASISPSSNPGIYINVEQEMDQPEKASDA